MYLLLTYLLLAIGVSFYCSIMEAVLLSVTPSYIAMLSERHPVPGEILKRLKNDINRPLSAILSLNTIAHTVGAAGVGAQAQRLFGDVYVAATSAILTFLILVLSEIIPKTLGARYWRGLARFSARPLQVMVFTMYPFVMLSRMLTGMIGGGKRSISFSREELLAQADLGHAEGILAEKESRVFKNLIRFDSLRARDIMTPRVAVVAFPQDALLDEVSSRVEEVRFSRLPLYHESKDNITGYVLKHDLLLSIARGESGKRMQDFRREIKMLPNLLRLGSLLEQLLERQEPIAALLDEYGGFSGIVTLEDIVETLLGMEIVDEIDTVEDMQAMARQRWKERALRLGIEDVDTTNEARG